MAGKLNISPKAKKIINIVVDVFVAIVLLFAFILAVFTIRSKAKGYDQYTEIMGKAYLSVRTDSMKGDGEDNFSAGDLIAIKTLNEDAASKLEVGEIITFRDTTIVNGKYVLNSHRIINKRTTSEGSVVFTTHGDNNANGINETVLASEVVGVYTGKASGIGHMFLFMSSSTGFFVCIVLPTLLIVAYAAVNLIMVILKEKKVQTAAAEDAKQAEREKMRAELLAEMGMPAEVKAETKEEQSEVKEEEPQEPEQEDKSEE